MTTYDQALMRKRAEELKSQWQTQTQISNTLNIEKNLWYFYGSKATQPPAPAPTKSPSPAPAPATSTTTPAPTLSWVEKLKKQNAGIIAQQWTQTEQAPKDIPEQAPISVNTSPWYKQIKPTNAPMDAWAYGMQQIQENGQMQYENIMKQYQDDIATIKLEEDQTKAKYKNADQVLGGIRSVEDAYKRGIFDPQQIASQTGISLDQVNQILRWEWFKALELQDRATEEDRRDLQYKMSQLQTSKNRSVDDLADQAERTKYNYDNQVEDMMRQAWLAEARMTKMWALTWGIQSSGYRMAINMIREESKRWLDRLKTVQWREQDDIAKARTRLLQDFETNTMQIKDYFDRGMNTLRMNGMAQIQQINQKYWVASQNTVNALKQLYADMEGQKVSLLNETMQLQQSFNGMRTQEIDILEKRATWWSWDRNKDIQTYLEIYKTNPALANSMFPELANQVNNTNFENFNTNIDFSTMPDVIAQFPNQARAKNNNPWWIKTASPALQQAWKDAGIQFTVGTPSPASEWWTPYTKFATIGDWLRAQWIALSRQWWDINKRLQAWVWTAEWPSYAQQVMSRAGIPQGTTFEQLTAQQQQSLQTALIRKESPGLYKMMTWTQEWTTTPTAWYKTELAPFYNRFLSKDSAKKLTSEDWKTIDSFWISRQEFAKQAEVFKVEQDKEISAQAQEIIPLLEWLANITWWDMQAMRANLPATDGRDLRKDYDMILASTALQKLIDLKSQGATFWALSDNELGFITNASTTLDPRTTHAKFKETASEMLRILKKWAWVEYQTTQQVERSPKNTWFVIDPNK